MPSSPGVTAGLLVLSACNPAHLTCMLLHQHPTQQAKPLCADCSSAELADMCCFIFFDTRFYFVSDPTLLEILSLGSDPPSVVPHFQSGLFDSLSNVTFDKADKTRMLEMFSQQGEKVSRLQPFSMAAAQQCHCCTPLLVLLQLVQGFCCVTVALCNAGGVLG